MTRTLVAVVLVALALTSGCRGLVEALGYTVVDEELVAIDAARDRATQDYVGATLPHLAKFAGDDLARLRDLGETLRRVSAKEQALMRGVN